MRKALLFLLSFYVLWAGGLARITTYDSASIAFSSPVYLKVRFGFVSAIIFPTNVESAGLAAIGLSEAYLVQKKGNIVFIKPKINPFPKTDLFVQAGGTLYSFILEPSTSVYDHILNIQGDTLESLVEKEKGKIEERYRQREEKIEKLLALTLSPHFVRKMKNYEKQGFVLLGFGNGWCVVETRKQKELLIEGASQVEKIGRFYFLKVSPASHIKIEGKKIF